MKVLKRVIDAHYQGILSAGVDAQEVLYGQLGETVVFEGVIERVNLPVDVESDHFLNKDKILTKRFFFYSEVEEPEKTLDESPVSLIF